MEYTIRDGSNEIRSPKKSLLSSLGILKTEVYFKAVKGSSKKNETITLECDGRVIVKAVFEYTKNKVETVKVTFKHGMDVDMWHRSHDILAGDRKNYSSGFYNNFIMFEHGDNKLSFSRYEHIKSSAWKSEETDMWILLSDI